MGTGSSMGSLPVKSMAISRTCGRRVENLLPAQVAQIKINPLFVRADAATFIDLRLFRTADQIARRQFHLVRRIALHEALAVAVDQVAAFAAAGLAHQDAVAVDAGGMELDKFHVHQRHAGIVGDGHAVAGVGKGIGGDLEGPAITAGAEHHRLGAHGVDRAVEDIHGHDAAADIVLDDQIQQYHSL